jgi:hypothetical protein
VCVCVDLGEMVMKWRQMREAGKAREACFGPEYIYVLTDQYMNHMNLSELPTICEHNNLLRECRDFNCRVEFQRLKNLQADRVREQRREYEKMREAREDARKRAEAEKTDKDRRYERPGKSKDGMRSSTSTNIQNLLLELREFG